MNEREIILAIKGTIYEMPSEEQANLKLAYAAIKEIEAKYPEGEAVMAICLRGAELASEE